MPAEVPGPLAGATQSLGHMTLLRLFGHPVLEREDARGPLGVRPKTVALIALLACNASRPLSRDWLAQTLWPDCDPAEGRANLRRHLHLASKAVAEDLFLLSRHTAQWNAESRTLVDVVRFDALTAAEPALAVHEYGGELCAGIDDEILDPLRLRYRSSYEALLRNLVQAARSGGDDASLALWLQRAVNHDPLDESAVREIMLLRRKHGDRAGALREYTAFAQRLRSELGAEPQSETAALFSEITGDAPGGTTRHNLRGSTTTFVGRERELAALAQTLRTCRTVTLTGPGGIGKTRLAMRVCFDMLPSWSDGVWLVDLESCSTAAAIWERMVSAMQLPSAGDPHKRVLEHLASKRALIVLDTCEHVLAPAREVAERLLSETAVNVLATSRSALRLADERVMEVGPLEVPPGNLRPGESPLRYGAYRLFVERAAMINPTFRILSRDMRALAEVLNRLDGLPLAIELVASRANVLTVEGMRKRLAATIRATNRSAVNARAQTIDDAIAWSFELLTKEQRMLFTWLSSFGGAFTADDVEQVCASIPDALEGLFDLVDASLVTIMPGEPEVHYRLLETTRTFARARLAESEAEERAHLAHAQYLAGKADALAAISDAEYALIVETVVARMPDYLAALARCGRYGWTPLALRLLEGLRRCGLRKRYCPELFQATQRLLNPDKPENAMQARLYRLAGMFALISGEPPLAIEFNEKARDYYRTSEDDRGLCDALTGLAVSVYAVGRYGETEALLQEVRERTQRNGDEALLLKTLARLGSLRLTHGDFEGTLELLVPAAAGLRELGEVGQLGYALKNLAVAALYSGRYPEAFQGADEALALPGVTSDVALHAMLLCLRGNAERELNERRAAVRSQVRAAALFSGIDGTVDLAECVEDIATTFTREGELQAGAQLLGYADALRLRLKSPVNPGLRRYYDETAELLRSGLGARYEALWCAGARESVDGIAALALAAGERLLESEDTTSLS